LLYSFIARQPIGFNESAVVAKEGARVAKVAREQIEQSTGKPVVSPLNAKILQLPIAETNPSGVTTSSNGEAGDDNQ
jgi:hypothetical protein